jgi:hypothetical protein
VSYFTVPRLRWSDSEQEQPGKPRDWRCQALILATVFLNLAFFYDYGVVLWIPGPFVNTAGALLGTAAGITLLFFVGPALSSGLEDCLGKVPALAIRVCGVVFLAHFVAKLIAWPTWRYLPLLGEGHVSTAQKSAAAIALLSLVWITSLQSNRALGRMALFTIKLSLALMIAALVRTRDGLPALATGFKSQAAIFQQISDLSAYAAPILVLAALKTHREYAARVATWGVALPLALSLLANGAIGLTTLFSGYYQPSLQPTILMALWSRARASYTMGFELIALISVFGAARFGLHILLEEIRTLAPVKSWRLSIYSGLAFVILWQSHDFSFTAPQVFEFCITGLAAAGGLLSARYCAATPGRIDVPGAIALVAGWTTPLYLRSFLYAKPYDDWCHPAILPAYGIALASGLIVRGITPELTQPKTIAGA